jgi:hypothetical protein
MFIPKSKQEGCRNAFRSSETYPSSGQLASRGGEFEAAVEQVIVRLVCAFRLWRLAFPITAIDINVAYFEREGMD